MEGLGISTPSTSNAGKRDGRRWNGHVDSSRNKGKHTSSEPPTVYTVSKIDAGQAVLISDQIHCVEFPSILLPPGCTTGSVVSISCSRNLKEEQSRSDDFWDLQEDILLGFGEGTPAPPRLRLRNVTQTSVTLEWDRLELATSKLLSLTIWRNGQRLAAIPNPLNNTSTKVSGLDVDAPYSFHLIMRTTAGTYSSQTIKTRTLTLTDTSGVAVCFGTVDPPELLDEAKDALTKMRARWSNRIQIETTHFVCTHSTGPAPNMTPPAGSPQETPDPGSEFQRASSLSIPIVQPSWVLACLNEKKMVPIAAHYLDKAALSGRPSSSANLAKGSSSRSQQHPAQRPHEGPREPIVLQKPPPPRNSSSSPEAIAAQSPPHETVTTQEQIEAVEPAAASALASEEAVPATQADAEQAAADEAAAVEAPAVDYSVPPIPPTKMEEEPLESDAAQETPLDTGSEGHADPAASPEEAITSNVTPVTATEAANDEVAETTTPEPASADGVDPAEKAIESRPAEETAAESDRVSEEDKDTTALEDVKL